MAITQDRLISLLEIIESTNAKHSALEAFIRLQAPAFNSASDMDRLVELYTNLVNAAHAAIAFHPAHYRTFTDERAHFLHNASKNRATAENSRRYRMRQKAREAASNDLNLLRSLEDLNLSPSSTTASSAPLPTISSNEIYLDESDSHKQPPNPYATRVRLPTRSPALDQTTLRQIYDRLSAEQLQNGGPANITRIAEYYYQYGADVPECVEKRDYWTKALIDAGLAKKTKYPGELEMKAWHDPTDPTLDNLNTLPTD